MKKPSKLLIVVIPLLITNIFTCYFKEMEKDTIIIDKEREWTDSSKVINKEKIKISKSCSDEISTLQDLLTNKDKLIKSKDACIYDLLKARPKLVTSNVPLNETINARKNPIVVYKSDTQEDFWYNDSSYDNKSYSKDSLVETYDTISVFDMYVNVQDTIKPHKFRIFKNLFKHKNKKWKNQ